MSEEETVKKLAEMKAYLEKRISELEGEMSKLRSFLDVVDVTLTEKSFKRAEAPKTLPPPFRCRRPFRLHRLQPRLLLHHINKHIR